MKQRMNNTRRVSSALLVAVFVFVLMCLMTLTVSAANTKTSTSMSYDFSTYTSNNDAITSGWSVGGEKPVGATKTPIISVSGGFAGVADYITREGFGLYENLAVVYNVPAKDRVALADYDKIVFTRKLVNTEGFIAAGARYAVVLETDKGDVIRVEKDWINDEVTEAYAEIEVYLQEELGALDPEAKLVKISFIPYVNVDDFRPETAHATQLLVQFFVGHITFYKAQELPTVSAVEDTYDGLEITTHNGKITGLDPKLTYEYKLPYNDEWITVSGVTEINGLYGAGYLIRVAADEASGLCASEAVAVNIPKALETGFTFTKDEVKTGKLKGAKKSAVPVYGIWTTRSATPYNADGRITIGSNLSYIAGTATTDTRYSNLEGSYYRRNQCILEYTLKPEEQLEFSKSTLSFDIFTSASFPYSSYQEASAIVKVFITGRDEPIVLKNLRFTSGDKAYSFNLASRFPGVEGYIERIVYYPYYNQDSIAVNTNSYPQISNVILKTINPAPTPTLFAIDMEDGTYKISGFKATVDYEVSYDEGATWEKLPEETYFLENILEGEYWFRQEADTKYFASEPCIVSIKMRREPPAGLSASGTSIVGLDATKLYEYAPYSIANDMTFTKVTGVSSIQNLNPGIYCIRYAEDSENFASLMQYVFIEGSKTKGKVNIAAQARNSSTRGFSTGEICSDVRPICYYNNTDTPSASLVMWQGWGKTTDMSVNETLNVTYAFEYHQAFDIKELYRFPYKAGFQGSGLYLNGGSLTGFYNKIRLHVVGSDVPYYDVYSQWKSTNKINFDIGAALPANAHGYVVAYEFFYYGKWPEISATMKDGYPYPLWTIYDLTLQSKAQAPKLSVKYNASGNFTISGLNLLYTHGYSTDGENFIEIPRFTTSFTVNSAGTYYVYATNTYGMKSELVEVNAFVDSSAAVEGLDVVGNSIEGLNENFLYEYRKYTLEGENEYVALPKGTTSIENLDTGLWEIRYITEDNSGKPGAYLIYGDKNGTLAFDATFTGGGEKFDGNTGFATGKWTSSKSVLYFDSYDKGADKVRLATNWNSSLDQAELDSFYYSYKLRDDEFYAVEDAVPFNYYVAFGNAYPYSNPSTTRFRFFVAGSDVEYYDVLVVNPGKGVSATCDLLAAHPDAKGYVTAIRMWPYASFPEGTTLADTGNRYPVMKIYGEATGSTNVKEMVRIIAAQTRPQGLRVERVDANLFQIYKITGFLANRNYEYSYNSGANWISIPAGTTEIGPIVGGKYLIRFAATSSDEASEAISITTPSMTPAFTNFNISTYACVDSQALTDSSWSTYPNRFLTNDGTHVTSYIGQSVALNSVKYSYAFALEHQFNVNEYPYFAIDFNGEHSSLALGKNFIPGAVLAVDIYFAGSSEPYTVTGEWRGYENNNGKTDNKIIVNLLELDPTLSGKTVSAFAIRPYSNVSLSPSGYNTSSQSTRYIYFRLYNVGFYSTLENVSAAYSEDYAAVNSFESITLEGVPENLSVGDVISPEDILVFANYSDGKSEYIDARLVNFDIPAFDKAGVYEISASYRGASASQKVLVDIDRESIELFTLPEKTLYVVGEMLKPEGLSFKYTTTSGETIVNTTDFELEAVQFDTVGMVSVTVKFCADTFTFEVKVVPESAKLRLVNTEWTLDSDAKLLSGILEETTVADIVAGFDSDVAVFSRTGEDVTENTDAVVGTGFVVATIVDGEIADKAEIVVLGDVNGNGKIDTNDYIMIKRAYLNTIVISEDSVAFKAADVNGNGTIDTNDYLRIKNHYRGTINLFD